MVRAWRGVNGGVAWVAMLVAGVCGAAGLSGCASESGASGPGAGTTALLDTGERTLATRDCGPYFLVDAKINGRGPYVLLIDTGASTTVVTPKVAAELGTAERLENARARGVQGSSADVQSRVRVDTLTILGAGGGAGGGTGVELRNVRTLSIDLAKLQAALGTKLDGILGYPAFADVVLTLDYPARQVRVSRGRLERGPDVVAQADATAPEVDLMVAGRAARVTIDSGKSGSFSLQNLERFPLIAPPAPVGTAVGIGSTFVSTAARLKGDVRIGQATFRNPIIQEDSSSNLIGARALAGLVVSFDQRSRRIRVVHPGGGPIESPPLRGIGVGFERNDWGLWSVSTIFDGSPAGGAGLRVGDMIVGINGKRLSEFVCVPAADLFPGDSATLRVLRPPPERQRVDVTVPVIDLVR